MPTTAAATATPLDVATPFGVFAADANAVVTFAGGLPGFERCRRFVLLTAPALEPFTCLHALDDTRPSLLTLDPRRVVEHYPAALSPADARRLEAGDGTPLVWLSVVRLDEHGATVNLRAPIVVNPRRMLGLQVLEADSPFAADYRLAQE